MSSFKFFSLPQIIPAFLLSMLAMQAIHGMDIRSEIDRLRLDKTGVVKNIAEVKTDLAREIARVNTEITEVKAKQADAAASQIRFFETMVRVRERVGAAETKIGTLETKTCIVAADIAATKLALAHNQRKQAQAARTASLARFQRQARARGQNRKLATHDAVIKGLDSKHQALSDRCRSLRLEQSNHWDYIEQLRIDTKRIDKTVQDLGQLIGNISHLAPEGFKNKNITGALIELADCLKKDTDKQAEFKAHGFDSNTYFDAIIEVNRDAQSRISDLKQKVAELQKAHKEHC